MNTLAKLQRQGLKWFARRLTREFIRPTTQWGKYFKPISPVFYYLISKPANFVRTRSQTNNASKDTLYFFYDLEIEPMTFDFVWALAVANAKREELGLAFMTVVLVPGTINGLRHETSDYEKIVNHSTRVWRVDAILLPSVKLLPCNYSIIVCATRKEASLVREQQAQFVYPTQYNVTVPIPHAPEDAVAYREKCLTLRADPKAKEYVCEWLQQVAGNKKVVVVTLRQYGYTPERNSNIEAWARFANEIDKEEFFVVFVPDTEEALKPIPQALNGFHFFHAACWNVNLRAALYEMAYLNLGVNTGPMSLCWFNTRCRYITFKAFVKNVPQVPLSMITDKGFIPGLSPAFANQFQKWVWEEDDFDIISREFKRLCDSIDAKD